MWRLALFAVLLAGGVRATSVDPGAPPGAEQTFLVEHDYDSYPLPVAAFGGEDAPTRSVTGRSRWAAYRISPGGSTAEVIAFYRNSLGERGYEILLDCTGEACGGFDFRFGAELLPPPELRMDVRDFAQLTMVLPSLSGDDAAYVSVLASRVRDAIYVQTVAVTVGDPGPSDTGPAPPEPSGDDDVPEPLSPDAKVLLDQLNRDGHVAVAGLEFATGGAQLSDSSAAALDLMARVLIDQPKLQIVIVGHSDNVGDLDANIELSQRRAAAVRAALVARGIAAERLEARGVGYLAPIASNTTAEGRAINRRVELVLR